ncbi:arylacetamide deacetylase-like isoform X2 [Biomphalaria glabrata]|uniref:Arylacetamide deacetylase-like isoform X2 n=1 Tax=Biomphalaria glabrata TaxID=6526 RepID=A0A9W2YZJ2_BIOGL|nr:arylacetamide deacetylase-like isoform X2 [Biomphalaria glabrata]
MRGVQVRISEQTKENPSLWRLIRRKIENMLLKVLVVILSVLVAGIAIICYTPLPTGIHDPVRTELFMGLMKLVTFVMKIRKFFGYGSFLNNVKILQNSIKLEGVLPSAKHGDVQVTREVIENVPVIIYRPNTASVVSPAMVYFHGGGWVLMTADDYDSTTYHFAKETNIVVISVDYRRAPQFPFPVPVQDCLVVTRYFLKNGLQFGIDVSKIGVGGDSAGGNLAAAVALALTREKSGLPSLKFQVLLFPVLQAFDLRLPSYVDMNDSMPILTTRIMAAYNSLYLGLEEDNTEYYSWLMSENQHIPPEMRTSKFADFVSVKNLPKMFRTANRTATEITASYDQDVYNKIKDIIVDPLFSPLMSPDLTGLPTTFIHACEFDVLRDEAMIYSKRLQDAGVKVKFHFGHGGYHADILRMAPDFLWSESGRVAFSAVCNFITSVVQK